MEILLSTKLNMSSIFKTLTIFFLLFLLSMKIFAAACCAGGSAAPALISGDDKAQITAGAFQSTVIGDAPDSGEAVFRNGDSSDVIQTYKIDGAFIFADRFQSGVSVPLLTHTIQSGSTNASSTDLGDIHLDVAYEFLPEWSYSPWKPKGYVYLQGTIPTGRSTYDAEEEGDVDALGKGFYALALGSLLVKRWTLWDVFTLPEIHYSFTRTFDQTTGEVLKVSPGFGGSLSLGAGVSPGGGATRIGLRVQPVYEQQKTITSSVTGTSTSGVQLTWDTSLEVSYLVDTDWSLLASYTDQTLLGPAINSTLNRTVALGLQHRWER